jgi:hypothetical protein
MAALKSSGVQQNPKDWDEEVGITDEWVAASIPAPPVNGLFHRNLQCQIRELRERNSRDCKKEKEAEPSEH